MPNQKKLVPLSRTSMRPRLWWIFAVASMEQLIGAALSTIVGIMIPLINLIVHPELNVYAQGALGASGLLGIAIGSVIMGRLMDAIGYLFLFRLCPIIITAGAAGVYFFPDIWAEPIFFFIIGVGVGGGYSLDSGYISEIMPTRYESFFVGLAKAICSLGFIGGALASFYILKFYPIPQVWPSLIIFIGVLGIITFFGRIYWFESPRWLLEKGKYAKAQKAAREFMGPNAEVLPEKKHHGPAPTSWFGMFKGRPLKKVILSGVSWACEGLGVYGFGVFLPILVMSLGLQGETAPGIPKVLDSVRMTIFINLFIGAGFIVGLTILHKCNIFKLMGWGFIICALALSGLLAGYQFSWPVWISFVCFAVFEIALNAGPHLVTFIVPSQIYSIAERGAGTGIATLLGKVGAILGVFCMPLLLSSGGIITVLTVSIAVELLGAIVTFAYAKELNLL